MVESKRNPEFGTNNSPVVETCGKQGVAECKPRTKLSLASMVRGLAIGDAIRFPVEKFGSVKAVVSRIRTEQMRVGWNARVSVDSDNFQVVVKRVK